MLQLYLASILATFGIQSRTLPANTKPTALYFLSGSFELDGVEPTDAQIESCAMLLANLCSDYGLEINRNNIKGHYELNSTACPGKNVISRLEDIVGKANFYFNS